MLQLKSKHTLYNLCSLHNTQKHPDCSVLILVGDDDEGCLVLSVYGPAHFAGLIYVLSRVKRCYHEMKMDTF